MKQSSVIDTAVTVLIALPLADMVSDYDLTLYIAVQCPCTAVRYSKWACCCRRLQLMTQSWPTSASAALLA